MSIHNLQNVMSMKATKNRTDAQNMGFRNVNFIVFFYMLGVLLVSNITTGTIRGYRRFLPYLRLNIILLPGGDL